MRHTRILALILTLSGFGFSSASHAVANFIGNYSAALWNTPAQFFTDEDWNIFNSTLVDVLDHSKDQEPKAWSNPKTKASGEFTVLKTVMKGDKICRQVKAVSSAGTARRVWGVAFCKTDGSTEEWLAVSGR